MSRSTSSATEQNIAIEESPANLVANTRAALDIFAKELLLSNGISIFEKAKLGTQLGIRWFRSDKEGYYKNLRDIFFQQQSVSIRRIASKIEINYSSEKPLEDIPAEELDKLIRKLCEYAKINEITCT